MSPDERLELDIIFAAERDERIAIKRRASENRRLAPDKWLSTSTTLQDHLLQIEADDQIGELACWLQRIGVSQNLK